MRLLPLGKYHTPLLGVGLMKLIAQPMELYPKERNIDDHCVRRMKENEIRIYTYMKRPTDKDYLKVFYTCIK